MTNMLCGHTVAMLVTSGFERAELVEPRNALLAAGADVEIISLKRDSVRSWNRTDWGDEFHVDRHIDDALPSYYGALVLPGGLMNPDHLRMDPRAVRFVRDFAASGRPIAAICHGPWLLVEADVVRGRKVTSYPSLKTDLQNALASWLDQPVVIDANFITSRRPDDLPAFCEALVESISRPAGPHDPAGLRASAF